MAPTLDKIAERALHPCAPERAFRFRDGATAQDLLELRGVLEKTDASTVGFHRNHFHFWVGEVAGDVTLARRFREAGVGDGGDDEALRTRFVRLLDDRIGELRAGPKRSRRG